MPAVKDFQVAIIGGGIAGVCLAIALHHRSIPVTLYEQAAAFGEIGAGVSFSPNAVQAMKICHRGVYEAFEKVCTRNLWPSKQKVWFDYLDGYSKKAVNGDGHEKSVFTISNDLGQNGVHRARFLDELISLLPTQNTRFRKRLENITEVEDGKLRMDFADGTSAVADILIGCDGIKSRVRRAIVGDQHPSAVPSYTHKYAYRGLVPMDVATKAIGEEQAQNACMHMGVDGHVLTFPVNHGKTLNIVAFKTSAEDWPDYQRLVRPAKQEDLLRDFSEFGENTLNLLRLTKPDLDLWAIFDLGDNPVPVYSKNRFCILGDAAHATSPHHGAGAGFCIEDSAVMAALLADERVNSHEDLQAALATFDAERRDRGNWLVQSSRIIGDCYEWRAEGIGRDFDKIEAEINRRNKIIADVDVAEMCQQAQLRLGAKLSKRTG